MFKTKKEKAKSSQESSVGQLPGWKARVLGRHTREWVLRADDCEVLNTYGIAEISHVSADPDYRGARDFWPYALVIICSGGSGTVRLGSETHRLSAGDALLVPGGRSHDFQATSEGWRFGMLSYSEKCPGGSVVKEPRHLSIHSQPLEAMMEAFYMEAHGDKDPAILRQILDIVHSKILKLMNPAQTAGRLHLVWRKVLEAPEKRWSLEALARLANVSSEHLRRMSQREVQLSPMKQVSRLRLLTASRLLISQDDLVEEVAHQVGFESERAFRAAFQRQFGCSPSEYRSRGRQAFGAINLGGSHQSVDVPPLRPLDSSRELLNEAAGWEPRFLSLTSTFNARFSQGSHPWFGQVPLLGIKPGLKRVQGIPFQIADEVVGMSFLRMASASEQTPGDEEKLVRIPSRHRLHMLAVLHACGWADEPGAFAVYRLRMRGGRVHEIPVCSLGTAHPDEADGRAANIQDWYFGYEPLRRPHVVPLRLMTPRDAGATPQYLYVLLWKNPKPEETLLELEIESNPSKKATLGVVAATVLSSS